MHCEYSVPGKASSAVGAVFKLHLPNLADTLLTNRVTHCLEIGCPTWIRTMTRRVKVACATITPSGSEVRKENGAPPAALVKAGNTLGAVLLRGGR